MAAEQGHPAANGGRGNLRAGDADRNRVAAILGTAYSEGRLSKDEYDTRLDSAMSARTFADLDRLLTDLPAARTAMAVPATEKAAVTPVASTNGFAVASLACGIGQLMFGPLATIPAIVFGHMARSQIKRTGEQGAGLALAGLILGWGAVILGVVALLVIGLAVGRGMQGSMPMH